MKPVSGNHQLSASNGRLTFDTSREGVAGLLGHDLTLEATSWSATLTIADDPAECAVQATIDLDALTVVSGTGGAKPLSDKDRREIIKNAHKSLEVAKHPRAEFTSTSISGSWESGATVDGTLRLHGTTQPITAKVTVDGNQFTLRATIVQTQFGIKPYSAMLGALKLADPVELTVTAQV